MPQQDEFTPSLKTETKSYSGWEESLPLPDEESFDKTQVEKSKVAETPEDTSAQSQPEKTLPKSKILNYKILVSLFVFFVLLAAVALIFNSGKFRLKNKEIVEPKPQPSPSAPEKVLPKRLSSAFIPKIPTAAPGNLSENWVKVEDREAGFAFLRPEEWQAVKSQDGAGYKLYYPGVFENIENFETKVLAKFSIEMLSAPQNTSLAEFLFARYNLSKTQISQVIFESQKEFTFTFNNTYIWAKILDTKLFILEGKTVGNYDFGNFLPIFTTISENFQVL